MSGRAPAGATFGGDEPGDSRLARRDLRALSQAWRRGLGVVLLIHYMVVLGIRTGAGVGAEMFWMSQIGLLLTGAGLLLNRDLALDAALTVVGLPHLIWLGDFGGWVLLGEFPLMITGYLRGASAWVWLGTAHHFYLLPLLLVVILRQARWHEATLPASIALFLVLSVISRGLLPRELNVNWVFGLFPAVDAGGLNELNRLPGSWYLPLLNVGMALGVFLPTGRLMGRLVRSQSPLATGCQRLA